MDKRFQVFVSSTFQDLQEERAEVIQALLELDCIPAGMELFPAANEDQWSLIKKVIDDCDYYIVVIGGRYGSMGPNGQSYTEMEYRYALDRGKPTIGFLHKSPDTLPANRCEDSPDGKAKLESFRKLVRQKACRFWDSAADLGSQVSRSIVKLIKSTPAVGWVRADLLPDQNAADEILRLRRRIEELEASVAAFRTTPPAGTEELAQGSDEVEILFTFTSSPEGDQIVLLIGKNPTHMERFKTSWNDLFFWLLPRMIDEVPEATIYGALNDFVRSANATSLAKRKEFKSKDLTNFQVVNEQFQTVKVQLIALGLMTKSTRQRSVKDAGSYWKLTPYGEAVMFRLRAVRKG